MKYQAIQNSQAKCNIILKDIRSYENDILLNNMYNTELIVEIVSNNGYCGTSKFILDVSQLENFAYSFLDISQSLSGEVCLSDLGYGSYINIKIDIRGNVLISGDLFDEHREQELKFSFETDQTQISLLAKSLYDDIVIERKHIYR